MLAPAVEQKRMRIWYLLPVQKLVAATQEPFVQAILDLGVPQMTFGRVALVGDAAAIPRPHCRQYVKAARMRSPLRMR